MSDDDLGAFSDDPLVRALTGPATDAELAGEAAALAAFRAAVPPRPRRRYLGRLGVGGATIGVAVALSGGAAAAAAAVTGSFPAPIQNAIHAATAGIIQGAPGHSKAANAHAGPLVGTTTSPTPATPAPVTPTTAPPSHSPKPAHSPSHSPKPSRRPKPVVTPTLTPTPVTTPTSTPTPTPTPTPTDTPPVATTITISANLSTVAPGGTVTVIGGLATAAGDPVAGQDVWLLERTAAESAPVEVASGTTGADGSVELTSPPLTATARFRLTTSTSLHSATIPVIVVPSITATITPAGSSDTITIAANGGNAGDVVEVQKRVGGVWQAFASNQLDASGTATFGTTPPATARPDHYRAILVRTSAHGDAVTAFEVPPA